MTARAIPIPSRRIHSTVFPIGLALLACVGAASILLTTRWGAGLTDDSYFYFKPAQDVLAGLPFSMDTSWQPLLSFVLIGLGWLKISLLPGVRVLNALLFGGSILLVGLTIRDAVGSWGFALLGASLAAASSDFIDVHSWLMSEPLFFFTTLLSLYCIVRYFGNRRAGWLILSALAAGLAVLTRFIGAAVILSVVLVLVLEHGPFWNKLRAAALYGVIGSLPAGIYLLRNWLTSGIVSHRLPFVWGPFHADAYAKALFNMLLWLMPGRAAKGHEFAVLAGLIALGAVLVVLFALRHRDSWGPLAHQLFDDPALRLMVLLFISNLFILYYSWGYSVETDTRKLSPAHLALLLALVIATAHFWRAGGRSTRAGIAVFLVVFIGFNLVRSGQTVQTFYTQGAGYANRYWAVSETCKFLRQHPDVQVVSTAPYGEYFYTGQLSHHIVEFPTAESLRAFLRQTGGYLVNFYGMPLQVYGYNPDAYTQGLAAVAHFDDATIYQIKP